MIRPHRNRKNLFAYHQKIPTKHYQDNWEETFKKTVILSPKPSRIRYRINANGELEPIR